MVRWLYLDLNSFFASCEQQENPELQGKPVAVVPMMADTTSCLAASYEAKAFGIRTGTRVADAKKMCPGLRLVQADHKIYVQYHHRVQEVVESCIPIHSVCSIDEFACELTGSQQQLEKALLLAEKIKQEIKTRVGVAITSSIGLATNMLLAKMATDMQKPNGLVSIQESDLPTKLLPLKLRDIPGIGPKMEQRLNAKGVTSMQQLLAMNEKQMHALWGSVVGSRYYYLLRGQNILIERGKQKSISHEHVLPPDLRHWQGALGVAQKLLAKAAIRMRKEGYMTKHLSLGVSFQDYPQKFERDVNLQETHDTGLLLKYVNQFFSQMPRKFRPLKVSIVLSQFRDADSHQFSFFENTKKEQIYSTVDKINEKFGKNTVYTASLHDHLDTAPTRIAFQRIPELEE